MLWKTSISVVCRNEVKQKRPPIGGLFTNTFVSKMALNQ